MEVKKTQTKAFSNLIASLVLIAFEVWAWLQTNNIKTAKKAAVQPSTFPRIMIIGMAVFTVILLIQSLIKLGNMKADDPLAEKAERTKVFWLHWSLYCCVSAMSTFSKASVMWL